MTPRTATDVAAGTATDVGMRLDAVLSALADPTRRRVVRDLIGTRGSMGRSRASFELDVSKTALSHHFRILRECGLVEEVAHGRGQYVVLRRREVNRLFPGLLHLVSAEPEADLVAATPARPGRPGRPCHVEPAGRSVSP